MRQILLYLDEDDYRHVMCAMKAKLQSVGGEEGLPDGKGNMEGRVIAEICRGWGESMGLLSPFGGEPDATTLRDDKRQLPHLRPRRPPS
jgi:hypothetical protein